jgi:D-arabinose 1-dehydrogenase-like Zn-dependent alcohol dehydrogenase
MTVFHAIDSCEIISGSWLAIVGCGGLGQLATQFDKARGPKVTVLDIDENILSVANPSIHEKKINHWGEILQLTGWWC